MKKIHQDPNLPQGFNNTFLKRFWSKVDKTSNKNGCWIWKGALHIGSRKQHWNKPKIKGYGSIRPGNPEVTPIGASHASWIIHNGPIPKGMYVLHNCPNG